MPQPPTTHVPPQNIEAEESVLGAMLVSESTLTRVIDELSVSEALTQRNKSEEAGGRHYVSELAAKVPAAANAKHYAEIVQQNSLLRRLLGAGQEIQGWVNERAGEPRELQQRAESLITSVLPPSSQ